MNDQFVRPAAVAGHFYPADPRDLGEMVRTYLAAVKAPAVRARAVVVPHAGLVYSGRSQIHPTGLLVGEFWEQQMVGERDIGLEQKSALLDR